MLSESNIKKRAQRLQDFGNSLPHAKVFYRADWDTIYFDLAGKMFGLMSPKISTETILTIKGDPEANLIMRSLYPDVFAGYHVNKKHWNSIKLGTEDVTDDELLQMIKHSYQLVWQKLPQSIRRALIK